ncbi:MAG: DUF1492 domain-containing protein [Clostridia bacterium]|nr:DUF1492 domain-containing protein [Clostridia bacterium]
MNKESVKKMLEEYMFDAQFVKEKSKEVVQIDKMVLCGNNSQYMQSSREYEEAELTKILKKKKKIEQLFEEIGQPYKTILYLKYISFLTIDQIADRMNYSSKRIYQLHSEGLVKLVELINNSSKNDTSN